MGKGKLNKIHMAVGKFNGVLTPTDQVETTLCGKTARRILATKFMDDVTCTLCVRKLKEENWHCPEHGFIADAQVQPDSTCERCGKNVIT